jgi:hypothetical protein
VIYEVELERTAERVRQLSAARLAPHREEFRALLALMTDRHIPQLQEHGWGDQLLVVGRDVPPAEREVLVAQLTRFRRSLDLFA